MGARYDMAIDVWSTVCVLHEIITGCFLFDLLWDTDDGTTTEENRSSNFSISSKSENSADSHSGSEIIEPPSFLKQDSSQSIGSGSMSSLGSSNTEMRLSLMELIADTLGEPPAKLYRKTKPKKFFRNGKMKRNEDDTHANRAARWKTDERRHAHVASYCDLLRLWCMIGRKTHTTGPADFDWFHVDHLLHLGRGVLIKSDGAQSVSGWSHSPSSSKRGRSSKPSPNEARSAVCDREDRVAPRGY